MVYLSPITKSIASKHAKYSRILFHFEHDRNVFDAVGADVVSVHSGHIG